MIAYLGHVLSRSEFLNEVVALRPRVAVFDCDGTLWSGDAGSLFMRWSMESGFVSRDRVAWMEDRYARYLRGEVSELVICGEMVQIYAGKRVSEMREAARAFFEQSMEPHIFPEMLELVEVLQAGGTEIWAVSSTNSWVIEEGVTRFNIPPQRVLAACVAASDGIAGSDLLAVPTDEGKVEALGAAGVTAPDAVFGNSVHDAAMLALAQRAFPVNPSPGLLDRSAAEGWPVYFPTGIASIPGRS